MGYGHSLRVLVVDDSEDFRQAVRRHLHRIAWIDMNIYQARDGIEALKVIEEFMPHIVITDTNMPRMNGIELLQFIKSNSRHTKVIVLFGGPNGCALTSDQIKEMGAELVLSKDEVDDQLTAYLRSKTLGWWIFLQMRKALEDDSINRGLQ